MIFYGILVLLYYSFRRSVNKHWGIFGALVNLGIVASMGRAFSVTENDLVESWAILGYAFTTISLILLIAKKNHRITKYLVGEPVAVMLVLVVVYSIARNQ